MAKEEIRTAVIDCLAEIGKVSAGEIDDETVVKFHQPVFSELNGFLRMLRDRGIASSKRLLDLDKDNSISVDQIIIQLGR